jgi:phosphoglycolate phosphatase-like HAD superfamily hydrolase
VVSQKPVVALDIDGTLGDYHGHFIRFAEQWTGRAMPLPQDINPGIPLHKHLRMSKATYRECKLAYRQGGMKRSMPMYPGASAMVKYLRRHFGVEAWICTTRPYLRLDNIDPDTRHWLRRNHIQFDGVLYGEHKYRDLVKIVGRERVVAVLDDLPELCRQAASLGLPTYLRDQPYNRVAGTETVEEFPRVEDFWVWLMDIEPAITKYKEGQK